MSARRACLCGAKRRTTGDLYFSHLSGRAWLLNYALRNYFAVDPVVNYGHENEMLVLLNEAADQNAPLKAMIADARSFGIGKSFLAVSVMPHSEYRGAVLFTFDVEPEAMKSFLAERQEKISAAAKHLHVETLKARGLVTSVLREFQLGRLELRCLSMMAHGVSSAEIASDLGIAGDQRRLDAWRSLPEAGLYQFHAIDQPSDFARSCQYVR